MPARRFPPPWAVEVMRLSSYQLISTPIIGRRWRNPIAFGSHALSVQVSYLACSEPPAAAAFPDPTALPATKPVPAPTAAPVPTCPAADPSAAPARAPSAVPTTAVPTAASFAAWPGDWYPIAC